MEKDLVSIIVPVFNAERFISDTINSVLNQSYNNWELILVNDCSSDESKNIILSYAKNDKRIKLINNNTNSKAAISRNNGIKNAKGRFICFLDADDLWDQEKLKKQIDFMNKEKCAFSFTGYEFANENGKPNGKKVFVPNKINYKQALKNTTIWTSTVMFDSEKITKDDIFMPNVARGQDTATWWKVLKKIDYAFGLNEVLSFYRRSEGTLSSNKFVALKRTWNLYRNVEHLSFFRSCYNFFFYCINAIKRRL